MRRALTLILLLSVLPLRAQIVNRLKVDAPTFERYAYGRMQQFSPANLALADSLYALGEASNNYKYKCLALSLEFPVRFYLGEYGRMSEAAMEIKEILKDNKDGRNFYFASLHEYCQYLVHIDSVSTAMLEARAMDRLATEEKKPLGKMYSNRIVALIHSHRDNPHLAVKYFKKAARYCRDAHQEQDMPMLCIRLAEEYIHMRNFPEAGKYCAEAEAYSEFFPQIGRRAQMTRALLYDESGDREAFWECYEDLVGDSMYALQAEKDRRLDLDIRYLRSKGLYQEALQWSDSLSTPKERFDHKHSILAAMRSYEKAYGELSSLMNEKDTIYIRVQNEDLAILDAEMNNAQLRAEAERLRHQNQSTILLGFIAMFAIAFLSILFSQWQLRENLENMQRQNADMLRDRRDYRRALDAKESENAMKIKILQNRKSTRL